jgi:hypothetical protein
MLTNTKRNGLPIALALVAALLLWLPLQAGAFPQNGGMGGGMAGAPAMQGISGTVVETMNSGGYTYALLEREGARTWVALPKIDIAVGNEIACQPGMTMHNFTSSSLNRSFESIVFSQGLMPAGAGR